MLAVLAASWELARSSTSSEVRQAMEVLAAEAGAALYADGSRRRLEASVVQDPLTKIANRRGRDQGLPRLISNAASEGTVVAVALIDLDHFKQYNDAHGQAHGDELLVRFADLLCGCVRAQDLAARWGGDEFAIAMTVQSLPQARSALERVLTAVPAGQTCSVGLALHTPTTTPPTPSRAPTVPCTPPKTVAETASPQPRRDERTKGRRGGPAPPYPRPVWPSA